jgi:methylenetetrahydrofolate reductase (NADPH)
LTAVLPPTQYSDGYDFQTLNIQGPKNGFIYQKSYLEFFVSPALLGPLLTKLNADPYITYYAVNSTGDLKTNNEHNIATAVTWGVFPGQEIVQPTIVEQESFMAWKDEAFSLWGMWGEIYEAGSAARRVIGEVREEWYLVNVVDNDYLGGNTRIFNVFDGVCSVLN